MSTRDNHGGRREPTLGDLDHLDVPDADRRAGRAPAPAADSDESDRDRRARPAHRSPARWRWWLWPLLVIVVVVLAALAWFNQDKLRAMLPRTHLNTTLIQADQALAAGRFEGTAGTSAHELYAKVLAEEPDNGHALTGLRNVGRAELARASSAIRAGDYAQAEVAIANARNLLGGGAEVQQVADALKKAQHPTKRQHVVIAKAQQALAAGHVTGDDGAAALFHQVLAIDPQNVVARHGLDRAGDMLVKQARAALNDGDLATADALVGELGKWLPREGDLPSLRVDLAQAHKRVAAIQSHLATAESDLHDGRFTGNAGDNALTEYQAVLKLDPDNAKARAGLQQIARALVLRANAAMDAGDADQARTLLDQAAQLAPQAPEVAIARARLNGMGQPPPTAPASTASTVKAAPTPLEKVEIAHLLRRAQTAGDAGHIMLPPGASAYDLYRRVLTIDPGNAAAGAGLDALAGPVLKRFNTAMVAHRLDQAGTFLGAMQGIEPGSLRATTMSQRLGNAWLDRAEQALAKGDGAAAVKALDTASRYAPDLVRMKALEARAHKP